MNKNAIALIVFILIGIIVIKFLPFWLLIVVGLGYLGYRYKDDIKGFINNF